MPTYEYLCESCAHQFEKFQRMSDDPLKECPECGQEIKRLFGTGAGILFKGGGFYETDYRSKSYQEAAKKDAPADKKAKSEGSPKKNASKDSEKK